MLCSALRAAGQPDAGGAVEPVRSHQKPVVLIGVPAHHFGLDTVAGSMELELGVLLDRLAQAGHTRIALVEQYSLMNDQLELDTPTFYSVWKQRITETLGAEAVTELSILVGNAPLRAAAPGDLREAEGVRPQASLHRDHHAGSVCVGRGGGADPTSA